MIVTACHHDDSDNITILRENKDSSISLQKIVSRTNPKTDNQNQVHELMTFKDYPTVIKMLNLLKEFKEKYEAASGIDSRPVEFTQTRHINVPD